MIIGRGRIIPPFLCSTEKLPSMLNILHEERILQFALDKVTLWKRFYNKQIPGLRKFCLLAIR